MSATGAATAGEDTGERRLDRIWREGGGPVRWMTAVNHKTVGTRFIVTGLVFLVAGGIAALLMRTQLAAPGNEFLGAEGFNEAFTLHGTTMMFLFAVPVLEGLGMYFLPMMLGTRDLPFPRLNAFGYWAYLFGGLIFFASIFIDVADVGWFAYVPLSGPVYSPGPGMDFWLLGISLVELSGIVGAIELLVLFLTRRAPGMSINRIPVFGWAVFVMAAMIVIAFPVLLTATALLETERLAGTRFFDPAAGGDPLLWQHLFWFFGHPEVYIMLIPAVGIISMVVPVFSRRPLAAYAYVVAALLAIGLISFGLWVHHMFATGISFLGLSFFAIASFLIAIPSGVQVFSWLTTMWRGRPTFRTPMLFVLGFLLVFVAGGITGVMVAAVPFDWQAHDTYFVVAHFHYVLIGGVVFPIFGGLYYWFPKWTGRLMSESLGKTSFWTMLAGFNIGFFPLHMVGLEGMPRRVFTYRVIDDWQVLNLVSTIGAFILAIGVGMTMVNMLLSLRRGATAGPNPWGGATLEWLASSPPQPYNFRELPVVGGLGPLWEGEGATRPGEEGGEERLREAIAELAAPDSDVREAFETTPVEGRVKGVVRLPGPSVWPLLTAAALALGLIGILASLVVPAIVAFVGAALSAVLWAMRQPLDDDHGPRSLPVSHAGSGWWGTAFALIVAGSTLAALVFGYVLLATGDSGWPPPGVDPPAAGWPLAGALAAFAGLAALALASSAARRESGPWHLGVTLGTAFLAAVALAAVAGVWLEGMELSPTAHAYDSIVAALFVHQISVALTVAVAIAVVLARALSAPTHVGLGVSTRVLVLLAVFMTVAWVLTAALIYGGPRIA